jgi:hypothetical protein
MSSFAGPSTEVFETSIWPCFTADCHWALSDAIERLGELSVSEGSSLEYTIDTDNLPEGAIGIYHFNGLRNIRLSMQTWPADMRAALVSATLCIGSVAVETIQPQKLAAHATDIQFKIFQGHNFLPTFVLEEPLTVRLEFDEAVKGAPQRLLAAEGLLVRIKKRNVPFFIAGGPQAVVTWDGQQLRIFQTASGNVNGFRDSAEADWAKDDTDAKKDITKRHVNVFQQDTDGPRNLFFQTNSAWAPDSGTAGGANGTLFGTLGSPGGFAPPTPRRAAQQWAVAHDDDADFEDLQAALALNYSANPNATWGVHLGVPSGGPTGASGPTSAEASVSAAPAS